MKAVLHVTSSVRPRGWFWAEDAVFDLTVSTYAKLTLVYLKRRADGEGTSFPSVSNIAKAISGSPRSVHRALAELVSIGALSMRSGQAKGEANDYVVLGLGSAPQADRRNTHRRNSH